MRNWNNPLDILGFSTSFLCALHCIAMPLVAAFGLSGALPWLESEILEVALIISTLIIAGWSLMTTFRQHGDRRPLLFAALGFIVIIGGHLAHLHIEHYLAAVGGVAIAYAHYLNWTLLRQCATESKAFSLRPKANAKRKVA